MKVPGTFGAWRRRSSGGVWAHGYRCERCGFAFIHLEVSLEDDEPEGMPDDLAVCPECSGRMVLDDAAA